MDQNCPAGNSIASFRWLRYGPGNHGHDFESCHRPKRSGGPWGDNHGCEHRQGRYGPKPQNVISSELFYSNGANATNANFGTLAHELANMLDERLNPPGTSGGQMYGGTYGDVNDPDDQDTGAQVEECMFGELQYP